MRPILKTDRSIAGESTRTVDAAMGVQIAILIDETMREFVDDPRDDIAVLGAMRPYMPGFKELMDTGNPDDLLTILQRYPGLRHFVRVLERVAAGID